jgi:predicted cupin superfamily sugar epimerase
VAPGFEFADFSLGSAAALAAEFPAEAELIRRLAR